MDKEYLLTYTTKVMGVLDVSDFEWFDTEEELLERANELKEAGHEVDAMHIRVIETYE